MDRYEKQALYAKAKKPKKEAKKVTPKESKLAE
jgi:hypothetical protein